MTKVLDLPPHVGLPPETAELRGAVREFLDEAVRSDMFVPRVDAWLGGFSAEFSRELGSRGWLGMTWPRQYGGQERTRLERFVVIEELLAAGAPVAAHWIGDRQSGPALLRYGTEQQRQAFLPPMARGELFFAIGMSEPDSGSDLASVRTRARRVDGGWRVTGTKVWTSHAHRSQYMIALCRTAPVEASDRHAGLSQLIIDLTASTGLTVNPIRLLDGEHHFNEVVLDDVFVADDMLLGTPGSGWEQVTSELAHERSGPERFLSTFPVFVALVDELPSARREEPGVASAVGELWADLRVLRHMSVAVASALDRGQAPDVAAAIVKDLGTRFESRLSEVARGLVPTEPSLTDPSPLSRTLAQAILHAPGFTLRGGTNEILRGIVARGLGLR